MTLRDYLQKIEKKHGPSRDVTFIIAHAVKDEHTPFFHNEFRETPIRSAWQWLKSSDEFLDAYIVINADHPPIDIPGNWVNKYKKGWLSCAVLTTQNDLELLYPGKQALDMAAYYNRTVTV
jgi:hypothetical protein